MRFRTTILQTGPNTAGIPVPDEVVEALGGGKRAKVTVALNGHRYRSSLAVMDGRTLISLSSENRTAAGVSGGDEVDVEVELDTAPRVVAVPADFAAALDVEPAARATWDGLSYSNQSWHVVQIESAKSDETRQRRIARSVATLREGKPR